MIDSSAARSKSAKEQPICTTWDDHDWGRRTFIETGKHPTMGHYQRYLVTCTRCGRKTTETHWADLLTKVPLPYRKEDES